MYLIFISCIVSRLTFFHILYHLLDSTIPPKTITISNNMLIISTCLIPKDGVTVLTSFYYLFCAYSQYPSPTYPSLFLSSTNISFYLWAVPQCPLLRRDINFMEMGRHWAWTVDAFPIGTQVWSPLDSFFLDEFDVNDLWECPFLMVDERKDMQSKLDTWAHV